MKNAWHAAAIEVRPATSRDAERLAPLLRQADLREIEAATTETPLAVLQRGFMTSEPCYAIVDYNNTLVAMFGVVPESESEESSTGIIWLLASEELVKYSYVFLRYSHPWIGKLHDRYTILWNYVDARNEVHMRWLRWCGFRCQGVVKAFGVAQRQFYKFVRVKDCGNGVREEWH